MSLFFPINREHSSRFVNSESTQYEWGIEKNVLPAIAPLILRNYCRKLHLDEIHYMLFRSIFPIGKIFRPDFQSEPTLSQQTTLFFVLEVLSPPADGPKKWRMSLLVEGSRRPSKRGSVVNGIEVGRGR